MEKDIKQLLDIVLACRDEYVIFNFAHRINTWRRDLFDRDEIEQSQHLYTRGYLVRNVLLQPDGRVRKDYRPSFVKAEDVNAIPMLVPFIYQVSPASNKGRGVEQIEIALTHVYNDDGMIRLPEHCANTIAGSQGYPALSIRDCYYDPLAHAIKSIDSNHSGLDELMKRCKSAW